MSKVHINVDWTRVGDTAPHARRIELECEYPLTGAGEPWQIAAMPLYDPARVSQWSWTIAVEGAWESADHVDLVAAVGQAVAAEQERGAREAAAKAAAERGEAERVAEERARRQALVRERLAVEGYNLEGLVTQQRTRDGVPVMILAQGIQDAAAEVGLLDELTTRLGERNAQLRAGHEAKQERLAMEAAQGEMDAQTRAAEIGVWAGQYGSARLRAQIAQGYDGWPLYLHERLEHEVPGAVLDKAAGESDLVANPTEGALAVERELATRLVRLGLVEDGAGALNEMAIRWLPPVVGEWGEEEPRQEVVVTEAYRPGGPAFARKTIRIPTS